MTQAVPCAISRKLFLIALLLVVGSVPRLWAWGPGHDYVNRIALDRLPSEIRILLSAEDAKAFVEQSHAPDDFTPWIDYESKKGVPIDSVDLTALAKYDIKTPYALHSAKGQAVNFILLHRALKDRDGSRVAFWGACLAHTFADEAACNHDPLIHYLTYAFTGGYGMKFGGAGLLDFGHLCQTPEGYALAVEALGEDPIRSLGDDPQEVLGEILFHGLRANPFMTTRGVRVASAFASDVSPDVLADSRMALAELGVYGVRTWPGGDHDGMGIDR